MNLFPLLLTQPLIQDCFSLTYWLFFNAGSTVCPSVDSLYIQLFSYCQCMYVALLFQTACFSVFYVTGKFILEYVNIYPIFLSVITFFVQSFSVIYYQLIISVKLFALWSEIILHLCMALQLLPWCITTSSSALPACLKQQHQPEINICTDARLGQRSGLKYLVTWK